MSVQVAGADFAASTRTGWGAVCALTLGVSTRTASEFMPVSLLTPIATDLRLTGGVGQAICALGMFAVVTSLVTPAATKRIDCRKVLLVSTLLMIASGLIGTLAPNFTVLLAGRAPIGIVIGGVWSMATAILMRLVPKTKVSRTLALVNGGNALATTVAAPLGSLRDQHIGWRGAFFSVIPLAVITLLWLF